MDNCVKAYVAGIIDGEGCVGITKSKLHGGMKHPFYRFFLEVKSTDSHLVNYLVDNCGGSKGIENRKTINNHMVYKWYLDGDRGIALLKEIYDYLICKKSQVDLACKLRETFKRGHFNNNDGVPKAILDERESYYIALKQLHGRLSYKGLWAAQ